MIRRLAYEFDKNLVVVFVFGIVVVKTFHAHIKRFHGMAAGIRLESISDALLQPSSSERGRMRSHFSRQFQEFFGALLPLVRGDLENFAI